MNQKPQYPLKVEFKKIALTNKMTLSDANGNLITYAHQKMLKLKEQVLLYADTEKTMPIGEIRADKVIDFSPTFTYYDSSGAAVIGVKRNGGRSIFKANYDIIDPNGTPLLKVREGNGWIKFFDALVSEIPVLGAFTGYFLNPTYRITTPDETDLVATIKKQPSFFEASYIINLQAKMPDSPGIATSFLAVIMRERMRG